MSMMHYLYDAERGRLRRKHRRPVLLVRAGNAYMALFPSGDRDAVAVASLMGVPLRAFNGRVAVLVGADKIDTYLARLVRGGRTVALAERVVNHVTGQLDGLSVNGVFEPATTKKVTTKKGKLK